MIYFIYFVFHKLFTIHDCYVLLLFIFFILFSTLLLQLHIFFIRRYRLIATWLMFFIRTNNVEIRIMIVQIIEIWNFTIVINISSFIWYHGIMKVCCIEGLSSLIFFMNSWISKLQFVTKQDLKLFQKDCQ